MTPDPAVSATEAAAPDDFRAGREAMAVVTRVLNVVAGENEPGAVAGHLAGEARALFGVMQAVLLSVTQVQETVEVVAADPAVEPPAESLQFDRFELLAGVVCDAGPAVARGEAAAGLSAALGFAEPARTLLVLPVRSSGEVLHVFVLGDAGERVFSTESIEVAGALATAACASLAQMRLAEDHTWQMAQQEALARAAKTLNESLDLNRVLVRICHEAAGILDADSAIAYRGDGSGGLTAEAAYGMPPEAIGYRMAPGAGLVGKVAARDEPLITNDYQSLIPQPDPTLFGEMRSAVAVPMHWAGSLRGVLAVYYERPHLVTQEHRSLLEAFGELAAAACRNASVHADVAKAARTDGLTGCLNHAALHDALSREIDRCERTGHRLSLVLVDMDDFKQVNEEHGHLVGDEVLRLVGQALRQAVRPYDLVARYGGDEFAIVAVESDESEAADLAARALDGIRQSVDKMQEARAAGGASAGVAEWSPGEISTALIGRADQALLYGKQRGEPATVTAASTLPADHRPVREARTRAPRPAPPVEERPRGDWPASSARDQDERLRKRTHQLALANLLGTKLAKMTEPNAILEAAMDELQRAFGYTICAAVRVLAEGYVECAAGRGGASDPMFGDGWAQPASAGLIGRCLRDRRPVIARDASEVTSFRADGRPSGARAELVVPLWVGEELWGAVDVQEDRPGSFDEDAARFVQAMADQIGSALRSAMLYERLEGAYLGTAEALAAAVESSKDSYTRGHSRTVVGRTQQVGAALGMDEAEQKTLRFATIFHDIGKIGVPESILNKRGPLTPAERREIERHTVVGERILSTVDFLEDVLPMVRHEHERWDGKGYPDGLAGEEIPLGSRIILACDAYSAMISDRPYRPAMSAAEAGAELLAGAGTQFDERVVAALLQVLERDAHQPAVNSVR